MDALERDLLLKIADLHGIPEGAYNIRETESRRDDVLRNTSKSLRGKTENPG